MNLGHIHITNNRDWRETDPNNPQKYLNINLSNIAEKFRVTKDDYAKMTRNLRELFRAYERAYEQRRFMN